jgi:Trk-type K+ transport system membrane component
VVFGMLAFVVMFGLCTAAMLLRRLEPFTLLVVFTPAFWKR